MRRPTLKQLAHAAEATSETRSNASPIHVVTAGKGKENRISGTTAENGHADGQIRSPR